MKGLLSVALFYAITASAQPEIVSAPVNHLYIPAGFDSNDSVEVVVTWEFPNSCFSRNEVKVAVQEDIIDISINAISNDKSFPAIRCAQMVIPFKEVVNVGNLQ